MRAFGHVAALRARTARGVVRALRCRAGEDSGSAAAEFAITLPALVLVVGLGIGALAAGAQAVRLQDAAADAARLVARGESEARARGVAVGGGATSLSIRTSDDLVCVDVARSVELGALVAGIELTATGCALAGGW